MFNIRLIRSVPEAKRSIAMQVFLQWIGLLCSIGSSLILAWLAVVGIAGNLSVSTVLLASAVLIFLLVGKTWTVKAASRQALKSSLAVKSALRQRIFAKLMEIGPGYEEDFTQSELTQLMSEGTEQLETYFGQYMPQFFYALIAPITLFFLVVFWDWKTALVLLVCVPLIPASIVAVQKFAKKLLSKYWGQYTRLSDAFLENLQGLTTLKVYQADEARHELMNEEAEKFRKMTIQVLIMQLNSISVMDIVAYTGTALGCIFALLGFRAGQINLFEMVSILLISVEFFLPMRLLGSYFHISMNGSAAADKMFRILDTPVPARSVDALKDGMDIEISDLSFSYDDKRPALSSVSMSLPSSGFIGIAGESGSGKSTLAALLCGQLDNYSGSLKFAGQEVRDLSRSVLLYNVLVNSFESGLFAGTVRDNLLAANPSLSDEELYAMMEKVGLKSFLDHHSGLDTVVEEQAGNLSGGQRQRLSAARALLKNSPVLVFDEATSSMDGLNENRVMSALKQQAKDHLVICISHRLANLKDADTIYVLKDGNLIEQGTHDKLMAASGEFARLWDAQQALEAYADFAEEVDE